MATNRKLARLIIAVNLGLLGAASAAILFRSWAGVVFGAGLGVVVGIFVMK